MKTIKVDLDASSATQCGHLYYSDDGGVCRVVGEMVDGGLVFSIPPSVRSEDLMTINFFDASDSGGYIFMGESGAELARALEVGCRGGFTEETG